MNKELIIRLVIVGFIAIFLLTGIGMDGEAFMSEKGLSLAYWLFGAAVVCATLVSLVITVLSDPKSLVKPAIALAVLGILFAIGMGMAEGQEHVLRAGPNTTIIGADISQKIGAALNVFYTLIIVAFVSIVVGEVSKIFR